MTTATLQSHIGQYADLDTGIGQTAADRLRVVVRIIDARVSYGRVDVKVEPVMGVGQAWVSRDRVAHLRQAADR